ncbi:MAG: PLP-dependent aminotransferase family protein [Paenibacillus sp.]|uniref:aminotransferase-like domain-containing protein n=1 Tax=Paenibacillus sp. TaxID=58172 RepID=UPI0025F87F50|nr:PLP-dependent aminotransferase family protein [Paenibacillus sp.]MBR2563078.1 PLP-dependent aminotransferase family protein [Paenibacillus sp.]
MRPEHSDLYSDHNWKPNPALGMPLYRQIADYIRQKITTGEWSAGYRLPSQRTMATSMDVNRSTVVTALDHLTAAGMIEGRHGGGTYVCGSGWHSMAHTTMPNWSEAAQEGWYYPNLPEIQQINQTEFQPDIIRLGTGELAPELLPHEAFNEILRTLSYRPHTLNYIEPQGSLELREALSAHLQTTGIPASPDSILIVSGSLQALHLISVGLLPRGSAVLLEKPSYLYSIHAFQSAGLKLSGIPMDEEGVHMGHLERAIQTVKKMNGDGHNESFPMLYTIPSFHNPTGNVMSSRRREELMTLARSSGISILEDAAYQELWLDHPPPPSLKSDDQEGRVLHLGTLSKAVSPGLRLGWLVGPVPVIRRLADIKMQTDYGTSSLAQEAATLWFADGHHTSYMERLRPELQRRRDFMLDLLQRYLHDIARWTTPEGGFYIWLQFTIEPLSIRRLFHACLEEKVLIHPGYLYDRLDASHIRLSYAYASQDEMERALICLAQAVRRLTTASL